jgi:hypothetical protein
MATAVISVIVGAIISYFIAKWQMKKNEIVHFSINSYDIGKGLSDEFPDFKLHFAGEVLADNVMVLKGGFMNTGRNDINGLKGENDIKMILPEECKFRTVKVTSSTEDLLVNANISSKNIINFGINEIIKANEYFKYTAILETSKEVKNISEKIKIQHRILNTDEIKDVYIGEYNKTKNNKILKIILKTFYILTIIFSMFIILHSILYPKMQLQILNNATNTEVQMFVGTQSQIYVTEGDWVNPFVHCDIINQKELETNYTIAPQTNYSTYIVDIIIKIGWLVILLPFAFSSYCILFLNRNKHIIDVIKANES